MSDVPSFPYSLLWQARQIVSVANLTRQDGLDFLQLAPRIPIVTKTTPCPLQRANEALAALRAGRFEGAAVLHEPPPVLRQIAGRRSHHRSRREADL